MALLQPAWCSPNLILVRCLLRYTSAAPLIVTGCPACRGCKVPGAVALAIAQTAVASPAGRPVPWQTLLGCTAVPGGEVRCFKRIESGEVLHKGAGHPLKWSVARFTTKFTQAALGDRTRSSSLSLKMPEDCIVIALDIIVQVACALLVHR